MKMRRSMLVFAAMLATVPLARAQDEGGRGRPPERRGPGPEQAAMRGAGGEPTMRGDIERFMEWLDELTLTDEQEAKIATILKDSRESMRAGMKASMDAREKVVGAIQADKLDEAAVRAACQAAAKDEEEMAIVRARTWQQLSAVLTPAQKAQIKAAREKAIERVKARSERMRKLATLMMDAKPKQP